MNIKRLIIQNHNQHTHKTRFINRNKTNQNTFILSLNTKCYIFHDFRPNKKHLFSSPDIYTMQEKKTRLNIIRPAVEWKGLEWPPSHPVDRWARRTSLDTPPDRAALCLRSACTDHQDLFRIIRMLSIIINNDPE